MDVILTPGAGVAGPKQTVLAWRVPPDPPGQPADGLGEGQTLGPMPGDWRAWSDWGAAAGSTPGALASPGESWQPLDHRLAGDGTGCLGQAAPVTPGPGRQTDQAEARWWATRRRDGWLQASFIPPRAPRDWRELPRDRTQLGPERSREGKRVPGGLERATLKLAAVATRRRRRQMPQMERLGYGATLAPVAAASLFIFTIGLQRTHLSFSFLDGLLTAHGHRCLPSGDATQMIPQPTFTENGTDPISRPSSPRPRTGRAWRPCCRQ
jgi:hypothetical protein